MNDNIKALIQKWENGETDSAEEAQLRAFFRSSDVPAEYKVLQYMFAGFDEEAKSAKAEAEAFNPTEAIVKPARKSKGPSRIVAFSSFVAGTAAVAAACVAILLVSRQPYCYVNGRPVRSANKAMSNVDNLAMLNSLNETASTLDILSMLDFDDEQQ